MASATCAVEWCDRSAKKRGWCDTHYQQWRRGAEPGPLRWAAADAPCEICGSTSKAHGMRRYCSRRCQQLASRRRRGANSADTIRCVGCGVVVDVSTVPGARKVRSDRRHCDACERLRRLRLGDGRHAPVALVLSLGCTCHICHHAIDLDIRAPHPDAFSIDHFVPRALGGSNDSENLRASHLGCNQKRHLRPLGVTDPDRGERQRLYRSRAWRRFAAGIRAESPQCIGCGSAAYCVDHVVAIADGGPIWDRANLQTLCRKCHNAKSQREYYARYRSA